jgi:hypothetical protein
MIQKERTKERMHLSPTKCDELVFVKMDLRREREREREREKERGRERERGHLTSMPLVKLLNFPKKN